MGKWLLGLWLTIVVPFVGVSAVGGPSGGIVDHLLQHLVMIVLCGISFWVILRLRGTTASRTVRVTAVVLFVVQGLFLIGNVGEAIAAIAHGGFGAHEHVFEDPLHEFFSYVTPSSFLLAVLGVIVISVEIAIISRRSRSTVAARGEG